MPTDHPQRNGRHPAGRCGRGYPKFIYHSLHQCTQLEFPWPDEWCRLPVRHSQYLFQWAPTVCAFTIGTGMKGLDPCERLEILLQIDNSDGVHLLDGLYRTTLRQLFTLECAQRRFRDVKTIVFALKEPLPLLSSSTLFDHDRPRHHPGHGIIARWSSQRTKAYTPPSFCDFLLGKLTARRSISTLSRDSLFLGCALLAGMRTKLRFNICDLKHSLSNAQH